LCAANTTGYQKRPFSLSALESIYNELFSVATHQKEIKNGNQND